MQILQKRRRVWTHKIEIADYMPGWVARAVDAVGFAFMWIFVLPDWLKRRRVGEDIERFRFGYSGQPFGRYFVLPRTPMIGFSGFIKNGLSRWICDYKPVETIGGVESLLHEVVAPSNDQLREGGWKGVVQQVKVSRLHSINCLIPVTLVMGFA